MLNGLEPVIIFQFKKKVDSTFIGPQQQTLIERIPIISQIPTFVEEPPIPIYLSSKLTGLFIDAETKSIDANTDMETKTDGTAPDVQQKGLASTVKVELRASKNSIGVTLISAMLDQIFDKLTSKEYSITYLHGAITIFRGLIHSFSISQEANTDLYLISLELSRGSTKTPKPEEPQITVQKSTGLVPL